MFDDRTPLFTTAHGQVHRPMAGGRFFLGFDGAWMALTLPQIEGLGAVLHRVLNCVFRERHLAEGLLMRSKDGDYRMPLTHQKALELQGLLNDILLLADGERCAQTLVASDHEGCA